MARPAHALPHKGYAATAVLPGDAGVYPLRLFATPVAIVDLETTGVRARTDRVLEIAIRRFDPASGTVTAFDTLLHPGTPFDNTPYHGIRREHVIDAPSFDRVAPTIAQLLDGAVLASYHVNFDARFLYHELKRLGIALDFPQLCLMHLKPLLGLGPLTALPEACSELGVPFEGDAHIAADDAEAADALYRRYLQECAYKGLVTFQDLSALGDHEWLGTLGHPLPDWPIDTPASDPPVVSRAAWPAHQRTLPDEAAIKQYFDLLVAVLKDHVVTDDEVEVTLRLQSRLGLTREQIRAAHGRAYLCILQNFIGDDWFDEQEVKLLTQVSDGLQKLGWSPGGMW